MTVYSVRAICFLFAIILSVCGGPVHRRSAESEASPADYDEEVRQGIVELEKLYQKVKADRTHAAWAYASNLTELNLQKQNQAAGFFAETAQVSTYTNVHRVHFVRLVLKQMAPICRVSLAT